MSTRKVVGEPEVDTRARTALGVPFETVTGQIMGTPAYMPLEQATANAKSVLVYEINAGQMLEDVRLSVTDRKKIRFIGGVSVE